MSIPESPIFQAGTFDQWYQQVSKELKGILPEQRIYWNPEPGIVLPPFATSETASKVHFPRKDAQNGNQWARGYALPAGLSPREKNLLALQLLQGGAEALLWENRDDSASLSSDLDVLFSGIQLPFIQNHFRNHGISDSRMYALMTVCDKNAYDPADLQGSFLCDGLFSALKYGSWMESAQQDMNLYADFSERMKLSFPALRPAFDATLFHEAGAGRTEELAWIIASVHEQWLHLTELAQESTDITLYVSVDHEILAQIAKFRALRLLWKELFQAYGLTPDLHIVAIPSNRSMTLYDQHNNILRRTASMYAAITGGADTVMTSAFLPKSHTDHRTMLNLHHLLADESHLHYVSDPAGGSYSLDQLAMRQAEQSWELFKVIENQGGISTLIQGGSLQNQVITQAAELKKAFHERKLILIGSNLFAQASDHVSAIPVSSFEADPTEIIKLEPIRIAEELELFRKDNEEQYSAFVFTLLKFGSGAMSTARANFISDFLSCGGYNWKEVDWDGQSEISPQGQVLVLCSADEEYAGAMRSRKIQFEGALFVAGSPENREDLQGLGANGFIHARSPLYETLKSLKKHIK